MIGEEIDQQLMKDWMDLTDLCVCMFLPVAHTHRNLKKKKMFNRIYVQLNPIKIECQLLSNNSLYIRLVQVAVSRI